MNRLDQSFLLPLVKLPKKKHAVLGIELGAPTFILIEQFSIGEQIPVTRKKHTKNNDKE
jgi:hypothetical protein